MKKFGRSKSNLLVSGKRGARVARRNNVYHKFMRLQERRKEREREREGKMELINCESSFNVKVIE